METVPHEFFRYFQLALNTASTTQWVLLFSFVIICLGILFLMISLSRLKRLRLLAATSYGCCGMMLTALAFLVGGISFNIASYQRLTHEREIARIQFIPVASQIFTAELQYPNSIQQSHYNILGDAFQIDARILKWHGWANLLGLDSQYQFERLSGRYFNIEDERSKPRSVYNLSPEATGIDLWQLAQAHGNKLPWLDTVYGSGAIQKIEAGYEYRIFINQTGLFIRRRKV